MVRSHLRTASTLLVFVAIAMVAVAAYAAESILVRSGEHDDYSRLVFDWKAPVNYTLSRENAQSILIAFDKTGSLDQRALDLASLQYVTALTEIGTEPLMVRVATAAGTGEKHFMSGNKLVLDVLKPKAAPKAEPAPRPAAEPKPEPAPAPAIESKPVEKPATPPSPPQEALAAPQGEKAPPPEVKAEPAVVAETKEAPPPSTTSQIEIKTPAPRKLPTLSATSSKPNVVAISSVSPTNMAAFELYNDLWLVNDKQEYLLSPQVSGEQRNDMRPIETMEHPEAKIFKLKSLQGAELLSQGGGLVWRILLGKSLEDGSAIRPVRQAGESAVPEIRGGKIIWPFQEIGEILDVVDPVSGITLKVVTVSRAEDYAGPAMDFVDFKTLRSPLGLAIWPKSDGITVEKTDEGVVVYKENGLAITPQSDVDLARAGSRSAAESFSNLSDATLDQLYDFSSWQLGGSSTLHDNTTLILSRVGGMNKSSQAEAFLNLAKMYVSSGTGLEALGFLDIAVDTLPEMEDSPEFKAIKGVALALSDHNEEAFRLLSDPLIETKPEILNWRSYALARLQDWQQAESLLPANFDTIKPYPPEIALPLALTLTEVALRAGDLMRAGELFAIASRYEPQMRDHQKAAYIYLKGEAARQDGQIDEAITEWKKLAEGKDDLYRVKGGLALTRLEYEQKKLPLATAVDRLERLRYAWRGDDLEAQVNYWLGHIYFDVGDYVKGLNMMRDAASFATGPEMGKRIIAEMSEEFKSLFMGDELDKLAAPDAVAIYERFSELNPGNEAGDKIAQKLVDRLVTANLYDRAIQLLSYQLDNRLQGADAFHAAKKLAVVHLFNNSPSEAIATLKKADTLRAEIPDLANNSEIGIELTLLKARALSESNLPAQALALLRTVSATPENNRLYADIAWKHSYWDDAAAALQNVIEDEGVVQNRDLSPEGAELILQRAIALNLANDRIRLANIREAYSGPMEKTERARAFEVITRPRQSTELADRQTLLSIASEVDLFSSILNEYKQQQSAPAPAADAATEEAAPTTPPPAEAAPAEAEAAN
jgi:tetratricopeptide (TPR) repeat protein